MTIKELIKQKLHELFSIHEGADVNRTINTISSDVELRGANIWILLCSAMLASIGLDVNSTAVIIGAMLISPLMSPILGIGLGAGISDRALMLHSIRNFGLAVGLSLGASVVYFKLSPLGFPTAEMAARTSPTLLDVGVAVFGGIAGIVANSRSEKTNAIPGVAIATALMPPLCTAGYGLAKGNLAFFLGAFYLFFINAVFIALSTYAVVRFLRFPHKEFIDSSVKRKMQAWIAAIAFVVMIPSGVIFLDVVIEADTKQKINKFIAANVNNENYEAIRWEIARNDSADLLKLYVIGEPVSNEDADKIEDAMKTAGLNNFILKIVQMNVPQSEKELIKMEVAGEVAMNVMKQLERQRALVTAHTSELDSLKNEISRFGYDSASAAVLALEIRTAFPEIKTMSIGKFSDIFTPEPEYVPTVIASFKPNTNRVSQRNISERLQNYMKVKTGAEEIKLIIE